MKNFQVNLHIKNNKIEVDRKIYIMCRYFVAFVIITYGWGKLMGSQFTILDSELDKPMGEVSGFWLTWYYFGYSYFYGNFIALLQIFCGFMLLWRKTVLLGASILFGLVGNIILIDIFYGIDLGGLLIAVLLQIAVSIILYFHKKELIETFWKIQNSIFPATAKTSAFRAVKILAILVITILPPAFTYWIANYNNRKPTEIDGQWQVVRSTMPLSAGNQSLTKIYFEHNRAFMVVFRYGDKKWTEHHFEINPQTNQIGIWEKWLSKDAEIFQGTYKLQDKNLILDGELKPNNQLVRIELEKR